MGWLGEALEDPEPDTPSPRRTKDLIEEALFARRRDLFTDLDLVFFDTTSLFFTGEGGQTLGQYGKSKDHRSDCKQMVLGMVIDGDGIPVASEMWPGNTTDVPRPGGRAAAAPLRGAPGVSGRRRRNDFEEADCSGRGAPVHSRGAAAPHHRGAPCSATRARSTPSRSSVSAPTR